MPEGALGAVGLRELRREKPRPKGAALCAADTATSRADNDGRLNH